MNKQVWSEYYQTERDQYPTSFAKFAIDFIPANSNVIDFGCGNGRDSYFLAEKGHKVQGIDYSVSPKDYNGATFLKIDMKSLFENKCDVDVIYSRFLLHAIMASELNELLEWTKGLFMAEFRCVGDEPKIYPGHKRNFIEPHQLLKDMMSLDYEILYFSKSRGATCTAK